MTFSLKEAIRVAVLTEPSKKWPTYDGKMLKRHEFVTASEASKCIRELAFQKHEEKATVAVPDYWDSMTDEEFYAHLNAMRDDDKRGIFARGNMIEAWAVDRLLESAADDEEYLFVGDGQRSFHSATRVSGTPDGIYVNHSTQTMRVLEFKSSQNPVAGPRQGHVNQLQVNVGLINHLAEKGLLDEPLDFPFSTYKLEGGNLLYINSDNLLSMDEFPVDYDDAEAYLRASAKAKRLFPKGELAAPESLPAEGMNSYNGCFFCPFKGRCADIEASNKDKASAAKLRGLIDKQAGKSGLPRMPEFKHVRKEEAAALLSSFFHAKQEEKLAKQKQKELRPGIETFCKQETSGKAKFQIGEDVFDVSLTESTRKGSVDTEKLEPALQEHGMTVDDFRKPETQTSTLRVKVTPEDAYLNHDLAALFSDDEDGEDEE